MKVNTARNQYFLISLDRNVFGQELFLKHREGKEYGRNEVTSSISEAKAYCKVGNAVNMAEKIKAEEGKLLDIQIHSWSPKNVLGLTTLVKSV